MKRTLMTAVFAVVVMLASMVMIQAQAGESTVLSVNVPFAFTVEKMLLPAGQYTVQIERMGAGTALGSSLVLRNSEHRLVERVPARPDQQTRLTSGASLTFHKYADSYFLAKVESYGLGCELPRTPAEKEMASRPSQGADTVAVAAE